MAVHSIILKPVPTDALGILEKVADGVLFNCGYHAIVLHSALKRYRYQASVTKEEVDNIVLEWTVAISMKKLQK